MYNCLSHGCCIATVLHATIHFMFLIRHRCDNILASPWRSEDWAAETRGWHVLQRYCYFKPCFCQHVLQDSWRGCPNQHILLCGWKAGQWNRSLLQVRELMAYISASVTADFSCLPAEGRQVILFMLALFLLFGGRSTLFQDIVAILQYLFALFNFVICYGGKSFCMLCGIWNIYRWKQIAYLSTVLHMFWFSLFLLYGISEW